MALSEPNYESVRVASELVAKLEAEGSEPVHVIGIHRHGDGTLDLTLRTADLGALERDRIQLSEVRAVCDQLKAENARLRKALAFYAEGPTYRILSSRSKVCDHGEIAREALDA
jgi:hypothetical protein